MKTTKIALISSDKKHLQEVTQILSLDAEIGDVSAFEGNSLSLDQMKEPPDILVINGSLPGGGGLDALERLGQQHPEMSFIVVSNNHAPDFLLRAMRAGVREVLPAPLNAGLLREAIGRIRQKRSLQSAAEGKILAFVSCKGGSGATFLATNLGYALSMKKTNRVALIDLNLQFGDASLFVSEHKPLTTLADVAQQIHRLDPSFLAASMLSVAANYGVLAAPEDPTQASDVKPEHVDAILKLARRHYDFILLDVGHSLDAVSIRALDQADMIFPVLQTTLPYIRDGKRLLGVFRSLDYRNEKIHLIVNRHEKNGLINLQDLETACNSRVFRTIPNHYEAAAASVNQGIPILKLARTSPISKALLELSGALAGGTEQTAQGWLTRFFQQA